MIKEQTYLKEGQAGGSVAQIITLIVGVGVATLVLIFVGTLGGQTYNLVESDINELYGVIVNETFTPTTSTAVSLGNDAIQTGTLTVINSSNSAAIGLNNFSISYAKGQLTLNTAAFSGWGMKASYTHGAAGVQTSVNNGILSGFEALEQTGDYLPIIVLAVVIFLVLSLVLGFTAFSSGGRGGAL